MTDSSSVHHRWAGWACVGLLLALALIFLSPALVPPADQVVAGQDANWLFVSWLTFARQAIHEGRLPLWDPYQFSGYPFLSNPQVGLFYPPTWLAILLPVTVGISWYVVLHIWLAGIGMLLFTRFMGGSWIGATLAALAFGFSGFVSARIWGGHIGLLATNIWLPWLLLALAWSVRREDVWSAILAGLPIGLAILAGHTTSLLYIGLAWLAFALYLALTTRRWPIIARQVAISGLMGLGLSMIQLLPFIQLSALSTRAVGTLEELGYLGAMPPAHLITLIIPDYFGEPIHAGYWSVPNFTELTYYVGLLPLLGLVISLRRPTRLTWFYVGLIVSSLLLALGSYGFLYGVLYNLVPLFRMVRAPGRAAFLFTFGASALLGEALRTWEGPLPKDRESSLRPVMRWVLLFTAVIGVAGLAATGAVFAAQHPTQTSGRLWHQLGGWSLALVFALVGGVLLWSYLATEPTQRVRRRALTFGLIALSVADLWVFGFKLVRLEPAVPAPIWSDARQIIGEPQERILPWGISTFEQNGAGQVGLSSVFGYNALEIAASQAFAASVADPRSTAYDILGVGYVIAGGPLDDYTQGARSLELIGSTDFAWVYRRDRMLPIARLAYRSEVIGDSHNATARVHEADFDPATTVILNQSPPCEIGPEPGAPGRAAIIAQRPGYWLIETESDTLSLLVISETAYPGWHVAVDGEPATPLVAYTTVRAVCVPAGAHRVEWIFDPSIYKFGAGLTIAALILLGVAAVTVSRRQISSTAQNSGIQEAKT